MHEPPATVYFRSEEIPLASAESVLVDIRKVQARVDELLGRTGPELALVLYEPCGVAGASGDLFLQTLAVFGSDGRVVFRYPWLEGRRSTRGPLLGTAAHELAEATVLAQVTTIDPYLRWVHDGVAELIEHRILLEFHEETARQSLQSALQSLTAHQRAGEEWLDLTRWRQVAPWLIRSFRFFANGTNLSLEDLSTSRLRVSARLEEVEGPALRSWLTEIDLILAQSKVQSRLPWREGEAKPSRTDNEYVFYAASFAVWLQLERAQPGCIARLLSAMRDARQRDHHVLRSDEALDMLAEAAQGAKLPQLDHLELSWAIEVIQRELEALTPGQ